MWRAGGRGRANVLFEKREWRIARPPDFSVVPVMFDVDVKKCFREEFDERPLLHVALKHLRAQSRFLRNSPGSMVES